MARGHAPQAQHRVREMGSLSSSLSYDERPRAGPHTDSTRTREVARPRNQSGCCRVEEGFRSRFHCRTRTREQLSSLARSAYRYTCAPSCARYTQRQPRAARRRGTYVLNAYSMAQGRTHPAAMHAHEADVNFPHLMQKSTPHPNTSPPRCTLQRSLLHARSSTG
jgi:hypothetical protein